MASSLETAQWLVWCYFSYGNFNPDRAFQIQKQQLQQQQRQFHLRAVPTKIVLFCRLAATILPGHQKICPKVDFEREKTLRSPPSFMARFKITLRALIKIQTSNSPAIGLMGNLSEQPRIDELQTGNKRQSECKKPQGRIL